ncbi:PLD nuclease N-terminal domain-containing protein [Aulosira sp. FACHB-615]|uniref:PLD nuclease N-terminal domain-containing protein n=1 Tax=Aulosira sp. FACHB-615 TaxID=2692777 RepID=UPI0016852CE2|nr:PLD nuclease N-terminal domain-containing protein [Aulosira sp. FACHB-615]MBD2488979.1 PLDc_N domain-containing protein [Aulosira sp. FACHB-615]
MSEPQKESLFVKLSKVNKDVWLLLFIVLPFFGLIIFGRFAESNKSSGKNCYEQAGQDILNREGSKVMNRSDVERYYGEMRGRCG